MQEYGVLRIIILSFFFISSSTSCFAQSTFCPDDPPLNPWLADSPYPTYHRNNYAQASTCIAGPTASDSLIVKARTRLLGSTSPWMYLSDTYPDGRRAMYYSNATHIYKLIDEEDAIVAIDSVRIDFDFISSFGWNMLLTKNKIWFTYDPKYNPDNNQFTRLFKLTDADTTDIYSDIVVLDTLDLGPFGIEKINNFSLNYDGQIVFSSDGNELTGRGFVGVIDQNLEMLDTLSYALLPNEIVRHNTQPVDENNSFYRLTTHRLIKFNWDGRNITKDWEAFYDFVNDGPTGSFAEGSGTTPTLMGWGEGNDQLIVVADGHSRNNLVAFWRTLPPDWTGKPGMDIRFADSISIPFAVASNNTFQSIENSPTVHGYEVAIAQYNGFLGYDCDNVKGVQKFTWDTVLNEFALNWATDTYNMNGVLLYSSGSNLLYGSGKEVDCNYYYYALNWDDGSLAFRKLLGPEGTFTDDPFYDAGNNNIIDDEGNIFFPGGASLVKLEKQTIVSNQTTVIEDDVQVYPNPTQDVLYVSGDPITSDFTIYSVDGHPVRQGSLRQNEINCADLPDGIYFLKISSDNHQMIQRFIKSTL